MPILRTGNISPMRHGFWAALGVVILSPTENINCQELVLWCCYLQQDFHISWTRSGELRDSDMCHAFSLHDRDLEAKQNPPCSKTLLVRLDWVTYIPGNWRFLGAGKGRWFHFQDAGAQIPELPRDIVLIKTWYMLPLMPEAWKVFNPVCINGDE